MKLTSVQVREKLGIGTVRLKSLVANGKLKPINTHDPKKKKYFMKFDSRDVNAYIKTNGTSTRKKRVMKNVQSVPNVLSRMADNLAELSKKIDLLYNMWK